METAKSLFEKYTTLATTLRENKPADLNAALVELENTLVDASGLGEADRVEARAYMQEYRRQTINDYEAGAHSPHLSEPWSGPGE